MDTDASVRALAPSSLWGGSRESLPLSVLSANMDSGSVRLPGGTAANERTSIYSATGIEPQPRNSYYGGDRKDGASVRSGLLGHGRADSITGSVGGVNSPLASPMEVPENQKSPLDVAAPKDENSTPNDKEKELAPLWAPYPGRGE